MSARHHIKVEVVNVRNRREVMLERPPFCKDAHAWRAAVGLVRDQRRRGVLRGEPFLVATNYYRQLGGEFSQ